MRKHAYCCTNCGSDIHARSTCPLLPCRVCNHNGHTSTTCPTKLEGRKQSERIRQRRENMSELQGIMQVFQRDLRIRQLEEILPLHIREVLFLHDKAVDSINYQHALKVKKLIRNNEHLLFALDTVKKQFRRQKRCLEKKLNKKRQKITRLRSIIKDKSD